MGPFSPPQAVWSSRWLAEALFFNAPKPTACTPNEEEEKTAALIAQYPNRILYENTSYRLVIKGKTVDYLPPARLVPLRYRGKLRYYAIKQELGSGNHATAYLVDKYYDPRKQKFCKDTCVVKLARKKVGDLSHTLADMLDEVDGAKHIRPKTSELACFYEPAVTVDNELVYAYASDHVPGKSFVDKAYLQEIAAQFDTALISMWALVAEVQSIYAAGIMLNDINRGNFHRSLEANVRYLDFGGAARIDASGQADYTCGTRFYLAPELLTRQSHKKSTDKSLVFSIGILSLWLFGLVDPDLDDGISDDEDTKKRRSTLLLNMTDELDKFKLHALKVENGGVDDGQLSQNQYFEHHNSLADLPLPLSIMRADDKVAASVLEHLRQMRDSDPNSRPSLHDSDAFFWQQCQDMMRRRDLDLAAHSHEGLNYRRQLCQLVEYVKEQQDALVIKIRNSKASGAAYQTAQLCSQHSAVKTWLTSVMLDLCNPDLDLDEGYYVRQHKSGIRLLVDIQQPNLGLTQHTPPSSLRGAVGDVATQENGASTPGLPRCLPRGCAQLKARNDEGVLHLIATLNKDFDSLKIKTKDARKHTTIDNIIQDLFYISDLIKSQTGHLHQGHYLRQLLRDILEHPDHLAVMLRHNHAAHRKMYESMMARKDPAISTVDYLLSQTPFKRRIFVTNTGRAYLALIERLNVELRPVSTSSQASTTSSAASITPPQ